MKNEIKMLLCFAGGLIMGVGGSYFAFKKYFEEKCDRDVESVEKAFNERLNELEEEKAGAVNVAAEAVKVANTEPKKDIPEALSNKTVMSGIINNMSKDNKIDYSNYYTKNSPAAVEVDGVPSEDDPEDPDDVVEEPNYISDTVNNRKAGDTGKRRIKLISYDDYGSIPGYDYKELYYYAGDGTLVDDTEDIIDNPELLIGDALTKYGFATNDEKQIYVRNDDFSCDYEIMKIQGSFA